MKKAIIVAFVASVVLFSGVSSAASCNTEYQFKAYALQANGSYQLVLTTTNANYLISQIEANPQLSGYVKGRDLVCDGYDFWHFANGSWWPSR